MIKPSPTPTTIPSLTFTTSTSPPFPKQPQFSTSFTPTSSNRIIISQTKKQLQQFKAPITPLSKQYSKKHSRPIFSSDYNKINSPFELNLKIKKYCQQLLQPIISNNEEKILTLSKQIEELKTDIPLMIKKNKFEIEENLRKMIQNIMSNAQNENRQEIMNVEKQCQTVQVCSQLFEEQQRENMQKIYQDIKAITNALNELNIKIESIERHEEFKTKQSSQHQYQYQNNQSNNPPPPEFRMISSIKQIVGSKISQPQSIASGYQNSISNTLQSNLKQEIPSIIRNLSIEQGNSEMVLVDDNGVMTDIKGIPIVDSNGNVLVMRLKQLKHLLESQLKTE